MMEDDAVVWHDWTPEQSESAFPAEIARIELHTTVVDADSGLAKQLLANPLPHLTKQFAAVDDNWNVSINRVNANRPLMGPRKLVFTWILLFELETVQGIAYRTPQPAEGIASEEALEAP
jgi:hypothetical protein